MCGRNKVDKAKDGRKGVVCATWKTFYSFNKIDKKKIWDIERRDSMKKIRLRKEIKDYFRERSGAIFFLLVVAVMSILVANNTNSEHEKSTNLKEFEAKLVQNQ